MKAIIIGATGATGHDLLDVLLNDADFDQVVVFGRRALKLEHPKLKVHVIDFDNPELWDHLVQGDVLFSCLGTTLKAAGSKEAQWKIDYQYQYDFAKAASENQVDNYVLVSSDQASADSRIFYTKMKGQLEEDVKALNFAKLLIFKPPLLLRKNSDRKMEVLGAKVLSKLNKLGIFRSQKPLPTDVLAQAMVQGLKTESDGITVLSGQEIGRSDLS